jgi:hypothetical protein
MGTWQIVISGHGIHHNGKQEDAETMAAVFVGELRAAGHDVHSASFVCTSMETDLLPLVPAVESEAWKVASEGEDGTRFLVGEGPNKQPIRSASAP